MKPYYFYLHTNGTLIAKPPIVVEGGDGPATYFEGPFVKDWWRVDLDDDDSLDKMLKEASDLDAILSENEKKRIKGIQEASE